jgi:hypothetical protein
MGYYLERDGRKDIQVIPLYDRDYTPQYGDLVLAEDSRRYFETARLLDWLRSSELPREGVRVGPVLATTIYYLRLSAPGGNHDYQNTNVLAGARPRNAPLAAGNMVPATKVAFLPSIERQRR